MISAMLGKNANFAKALVMDGKSVLKPEFRSILELKQKSGVG